MCSASLASERAILSARGRGAEAIRHSRRINRNEKSLANARGRLMSRPYLSSLFPRESDSVCVCQLPVNGHSAALSLSHSPLTYIHTHTHAFSLSMLFEFVSLMRAAARAVLHFPVNSTYCAIFVWRAPVCLCSSVCIHSFNGISSERAFEREDDDGPFNCP